MSWFRAAEGPPSLLEITAKCVAETVPFSSIEERVDRVPEPVQRRIIFHSFPRNERDIYIYSSLSRNQEFLPFSKGLKILEAQGVENVLQVGFHLSGTVTSKSGDEKSYKVSLSFDRCKITSTQCSCGVRDIFWCEHVVALSLYRIRFAENIELRVPISETLLQMDRNQLQKLVQYLIADHTDVLPTAQLLADKILMSSSEINRIAGAPDPTAGASAEDDHAWALDEEQVVEQVKGCLSQGAYYNANKQLHALFAKVREMLRARDSNGPRLLSLITQEFLNDPRLLQWKVQGTPMQDKHRQLWDQLGTLWTCVVMNPRATSREKKSFTSLLHKFNSNPATPLEDPDFPTDDTTLSYEEEGRRPPKRRRRIRTIFNRALEVASTRWDSLDLNYAMEDLPLSAARVDALRSHGYEDQAIRLAVLIVRHLGVEERKITTLEPIFVLFDTLTEASLRDGTYVHVHSGDETYLSLAFTVALQGLGVHRLMPHGQYAQEKVGRLEDKLICKLQELESRLSEEGHLKDEIIIGVLKSRGRWLLESDSSGLSPLSHPSSIPLHTFARYLFNSLLPFDRDLAYAIGLRAMRLRYLDEWDDLEDPPLIRRYPRWFTLGQIEIQQCTLATTLLCAARTDACLLKTILDNATTNIHSSSHLFRLAQEAQRHALPESGPRNVSLLEVSYQLGLKVMRMTLHSVHRRRIDMVHWIVTCAVEVGVSALLLLLQSWGELFTPTEAASKVATTIMSRTTGIRLNLGLREVEELAASARTLALQCARKDPQNCALSALSLCENEPITFETAYQIVVEAASNVMNSAQLFAIARYMQHRGYDTNAYKLALLAMENVVIGFNQDTHPAITDIYWACGLSQALGRSELSGLIPLLVKNVQCATVLSEILKRVAVPEKRRCLKGLPYDRPPLKLLVEAAMAAFVATTHSRLTHISPRHYTDFIEFLSKAKETFLLASDGGVQFAALLDNMKISYKGKKKLMFLVKERFG